MTKQIDSKEYYEFFKNNDFGKYLKQKRTKINRSPYLKYVLNVKPSH